MHLIKTIFFKKKIKINKIILFGIEIFGHKGSLKINIFKIYIKCTYHVVEYPLLINVNWYKIKF